MRYGDAFPAELEPVLVASADFTVSKGPVFVSYAAVYNNSADFAGTGLCIEIPAVVNIMMGNAANEFIADAGSDFCRKAVGIVFGRVAVVEGFTVDNPVV